MILMRILPGVLKELSKHVPTVLFQAVDWSELASEIPKISRRIMQKEGFDDLYRTQKALLDPYHIQLTDREPSGTPLLLDRETGCKLLTLYFSQLFSGVGLFLDLRQGHFSSDGPNLRWHPTSLWTSFDENFREGLLKVYEGFYLENDQLYYEGLEEIGLLRNDFSEEDKKLLGGIFRSQFGGALDEDMRFELDHLKSSIVKMSNFLLARRVKIPKDFLYLGIYLVTLYSTLEATKARLPVKQIYLDVRGRFAAKEIG